MGPPARKKAQISQEAFDSVVKENVDDFGMEMDEALADAITTFELQGVDLSGIVREELSIMLLQLGVSNVNCSVLHHWLLYYCLHRFVSHKVNSSSLWL